MLHKYCIWILLNYFACSTGYLIFEDHVSPFKTPITQVETVFIAVQGSPNVFYKVNEFTLHSDSGNLQCNHVNVHIITPFNLTTGDNSPKLTAYLKPNGGLLSPVQESGQECRKIKR